MTGRMFTPARAALNWLARLRIGAATKRHNRLAVGAYEDLARWAGDERQKQVQAVAAAEAVSREWGLGGLEREGEAEIRAAFRESWRNRKSQTTRYIEDLRHEETFVHAAWRSIRRRPWPEYGDIAEIERLEREWEE